MAERGEFITGGWVVTKIDFRYEFYADPLSPKLLWQGDDRIVSVHNPVN
jgi:hypothetical protein